MSRPSGASRRTNKRRRELRQAEEAKLRSDLEATFTGFDDRADKLERLISWHILAQRPGQDVTITYADGTNYTARYVGSGSRRIDDPQHGPYDYFSLNFVADQDQEINQ